MPSPLAARPTARAVGKDVDHRLIPFRVALASVNLSGFHSGLSVNGRFCPLIHGFSPFLGILRGKSKKTDLGHLGGKKRENSELSSEIT